MKRILIFPLVTGGILTLFSSIAQAATLTVTNSLPFRETQWSGPISLPQFNPANFGGAPLRGITVTAQSRSQGQYVLTAIGSELEYGDPNDRVGSRVRVTGPSNSLILRPAPITNIGIGELQKDESVTIPLSGIDQRTDRVNQTFFSTFIGSGVVNFQILAQALIDVTLSGTSFSTAGTEVRADVEVSVTYDYAEIPDRGLGILGVGFCLLAGLALKGYGNQP